MLKNLSRGQIFAFLSALSAALVAVSATYPALAPYATMAAAVMHSPLVVMITSDKPAQ